MPILLVARLFSNFSQTLSGKLSFFRDRGQETSFSPSSLQHRVRGRSAFREKQFFPLRNTGAASIREHYRDAAGNRGPCIKHSRDSGALERGKCPKREAWVVSKINGYVA